jgi:hypothetical protein
MRTPLAASPERRAHVGQVECADVELRRLPIEQIGAVSTDHEIAQVRVAVSQGQRAGAAGHQGTAVEGLQVVGDAVVDIAQLDRPVAAHLNPRLAAPGRERIERRPVAPPRHSRERTLSPPPVCVQAGHHIDRGEQRRGRRDAGHGNGFGARYWLPVSRGHVDQHNRVILSS